jgi:hypothetical protein
MIREGAMNANSAGAARASIAPQGALPTLRAQRAVKANPVSYALGAAASAKTVKQASDAELKQVIGAP